MSISVMKRLTVLAPKNQADPLVRRLMKLKCVEIGRTRLNEDAAIMRHDCDAARAESEKRVARVTETIDFLDKYAVQPSKWRRKPIRTDTGLFSKADSVASVWEVVDQVLALKQEIAGCYVEDRAQEARRAMLLPWLEYDLALDLRGTKTCHLWHGSLPADTLISSATDALKDTCAGIEEVGRDPSGVYVTVLFHQSEEEAVNAALSSLGFVKLPMNDVEGYAKDAYARAGKVLDEVDVRLQRCQDRLRELATYMDDVKVLFDMEKTSLLAAQHRQNLANTEECVWLEGWIPEDRRVKVEQALDKLPCAYEISEPAVGEEPPVLLRNNGYASNFEWVVGMYSYPKYGSYDPTFVMSIYYFVIFGLMFADVGYGLLLTLAGLIAPRALSLSPGMKRAVTMFGYCGIACTLLGVVFGGWFGDLPYAIMTNYMGYESVAAAKAAAPFFNGVVLTLGGQPLSLNPLENPIPFLIISLAMGLIHIVGGMAVKFYLLCREGHIWSAVFDIGSYWILFAGIGVLFVQSTVGLVLTVLGVLMIVLTQGRSKKGIISKFVFGLKGLYDLINYASDLLSYSRILALGLAAGVMAQVFNLLGTLGGTSVGGFILLIFVMLVGHGLNMAINLLGAFVHTCRLQYLEFFSKFYEDGGKPFVPATPCEQYSDAESERQDA